jgi:hypothetical protein
VTIYGRYTCLNNTFRSTTVFSARALKYRDKLKRNSSNNVERKLKVERVEACMNCQLFTECEKIGMLEACEKFVEVERDRPMIIARLDEYAKIASRRYH